MTQTRNIGAPQVGRGSLLPFGSTVADAAGVAGSFVERASAIAWERFTENQQISYKAHGEVVTEVDLICERSIAFDIHETFPSHSIISEESFLKQEDSSWSWIVDPLDGSNNYAMGLPLFGSTVTLCFNSHPIVAAISVAPGRCFTAVRNSGVESNREYYGRASSMHRPKIAALWQGYEVQHQDSTRVMVRECIEGSVSRIVENWAPVVDVDLIIRGAIDVVVGIDCSGLEIPAALLLLQESGAQMVSLESSDNRLSFIAGEPSLVEEVTQQLRASIPQFNQSLERPLATWSKTWMR